MNKFTAIILTALPVEYQAVRNYLTDVTKIDHPQGTVYEFGHFGINGITWNVALAQAGAGNVRTAIEVERAISFVSPTYVFFVGVAGGIKDVCIGDVVAGTKVYGYESGKAEHSFLPRPEVGESSYALVQKAYNVARDNLWQKRLTSQSHQLPKAIVAPIVAGEKVISSFNSPFYQFIRTSYSDAVAVEMEGYGFLRAGYANANVQFLVIRGISDLIEKKNEADSRGSQVTASANAAAFAFEMLSLISSKSHDDSQAKLSISGEQDLWKALEDVVVELYPKGPLDAEIWGRAGGDVALLDLNLNGRAAWYSALRKLSQGGGGSAISPKSLLAVIRKDFPHYSLFRGALNTLLE